MTGSNGRGRPIDPDCQSASQGGVIAVLALSGLSFLISGTFGIAKAAPQELDCILTDVETKSEEAKFDSQVAVEKRAIVVTFDEQQGSLSLRKARLTNPFKM